ncbi:MAG: organic solvent tolerance protein OstA [Marinilabiliaceae bacterium]|nr:organic solvent tolerance protein OstA [Marinilabiliaceae bacterium]
MLRICSFCRLRSGLRAWAILLVMMPLVLFAQRRTRVELEKADVLKADESKYGKGVQAVFGNVRFKHVNTIMYCDSAYLYRDSNMVVAYSNIHVIQNDSIHLYGDNMDYLGNQNLARVRNNVRMVKGDVTLTTQNLDYDRLGQVGYYFDGGTVMSGDNKLESHWGYYYPNTDMVHFKETVRVYNPQYTIYSDTLKYHTLTEVVSILGPTDIISSDSINKIYSEDGYYNTQTDFSQLRRRSVITGKEQVLTGDTINYNRRSGLGEVYGNMVLTDSVNNVIIKGNYGLYNELTKSALSTRNACLLQVYNNDTLYLHADTLRMDTIPELGTKLVRAYYKVKFFRPDLQGRCDSMVFNLKDSTNTFYHDPVIWAQGSQLTAETITMFSHNEVLERVELENSAFVVQPEDTTFLMFNQIKGKNMIGYIRNNELYKIDVDGNGQTIYHPKDKELIIGVNRAESSNMTLMFKERRIDRIIMRVTPTGNMNPPLFLPVEDVKLEGFLWLEKYRPKNKEDIFRTDVMPVMEARPTYDDFQEEGVESIKGQK